MTTQEKLDLAIQALQFYGNMDNYQHFGSGIDPDLEAVNKIDKDCGIYARHVLDVIKLEK